MTVKGYIDTQNNEKYVLEFTTPEQIYFPNNCIICGKKTEAYLQKNLYGKFVANKDYKFDYTAEFPICGNCQKNIEMKMGLASKSGKILCTSIIFGILLALIISNFFKAYFFSIGILIIAIIVPYVNHKTKMKPKLKAEDFFEIKFEPLDQEKIKIILKNIEYARIVENLNRKKIKEVIDEVNNKKITEDSETIKSEPLDNEAIDKNDNLDPEKVNENSKLDKSNSTNNT